MMAKVQAEYRMVKDLPPPSAGAGAKGGVTSAAPAAAAPSQGMLTDKSGSGAGGSTSLVVKSTPATAPVAPNAGRTLGIRRNQAGLDVPKPEWHAPWKLMRVVSGHLGWVRAIAIDPTNEWFVTGSADRTIKVWHPHRPCSSSPHISPYLPISPCISLYQGVGPRVGRAQAHPHRAHLDHPRAGGEPALALPLLGGRGQDGQVLGPRVQPRHPQLPRPPLGCARGRWGWGGACGWG